MSRKTKPPFLDIADLDEDERIEMIGHRAMVHTDMPVQIDPIAYKVDKDLRAEERTMEAIRNGEKDSRGFWIPGPLWWLWHCTESYDNHWIDKGLSSPHRHFPNLPYLPWLFAKLLSERIIFIPKSREMMVSWCVVGYCTWASMLFPSTRVLIQAQKADKAAELVRGTEPPGYSRTLYERQEDWLKRRHPLALRMEDLPADKMVWKNQSAIQAVPKGADQVRLFHPTIMVFDEAAHLEEFEASFGAALPVCKQIIAVSSAAPGFFADICSTES